MTDADKRFEEEWRAMVEQDRRDRERRDRRDAIWHWTMVGALGIAVAFVLLASG